MTVYRACDERDLPVLKSIWLSCFEEREDAAELFFQRNKAVFHAYACEADGELVSALYLLDCSLGGKSAHYLCGAATLPAYRGRGLMSALIRFALQDAARRGDHYSLLLPASETLYGFYAGFGYLPSCAVKSAVFDTDTDRQPCGGSPDLTALQAVCSGGKSLLWDSDMIRFAADYYGCYGAVTVQSADAFAICQRYGRFTDVYYAVFRKLDDLKALLKAEGIGSFHLTAAKDCPLFDGEIVTPCGMILPLRGGGAPEDVYIGITLQ
ncbi:MAG: GNAT family N-acetyltransferase [Ruminococcus sp.]|nr:GNAT family N-acetyltransferase [Ruminococcus sp.]